MKELILLLKKFFGYTSFRPLQADIIERIVNKQDSMVLMPTGGGKSICFQLPAIYLPGTAIVISPLIALMKDQVEGLITNGIPAASLNSSQPAEESQRIRQLCLQGKIKLLYISPERLVNELDYMISRMQISLIAIDEAHCISQWGHDFRPEYTQLAVLKERFPNTPMVALTATADKITRTDILNQLGMNTPEVFISSFDRPNLSLNVVKDYDKKEKIRAITRFIKARKNQCGIIYCLSRKSTEELADKLTALGIKAIAYNAGLTPVVREKAQNDFINDRVDVVCATIAFGMGIDKSNVRWVIHYNMPKCIEGYYQEIGRAGRDGLKSDTLLFYSYSDMIMLRKFAEESGQSEINLEKLQRMQRYCEADVCRRRILLNYFNEEAQHDCGNCDVCQHPPKRFDGTILVQKALSGIVRTEQHVGLNLLIDILRGSLRNEITSKGYNRIKTFGVGKDHSYKEWSEYIHQMVQLGYIEVNYADANLLMVTPLGNRVLYGELTAQLAVYTATNYDLVVSEKPWNSSKSTSRGSKERTTNYTSASDSAYKDENWYNSSNGSGDDRDLWSAPPSGGANYTPRPTARRSASETILNESLFDALRKLRTQLADKEGVPAYQIFSDKSLNEMVELKPKTLDRFSEINGVGSLKLEKYGKVFTNLIKFVLKPSK